MQPAHLTRTKLFLLGTLVYASKLIHFSEKIRETLFWVPQKKNQLKKQDLRICNCQVVAVSCATGLLTAVFRVDSVRQEADYYS